ncbi:MAG: hypothetical protein VB835_18080 [Pirellulales bacterium]
MPEPQMEAANQQTQRRNAVANQAAPGGYPVEVAARVQIDGTVAVMLVQRSLPGRPPHGAEIKGVNGCLPPTVVFPVDFGVHDVAGLSHRRTQQEHQTGRPSADHDASFVRKSTARKPPIYQLRGSVSTSRPIIFDDE